MKTMRTFLVAGLLLTGISSFAQAQTAPMKGPEIPHSEMNRKAPHNHHKLCAPNPHTWFFPQRMERIHEPVRLDSQRRAVPVPKK
ncbi:MAG: hypothetical protein BGO87_05555 [Flavobacteriia bacterium 40-80]|nr:MAG: hypothetical protein BGO87_05555 [Flavobacteriia bacterium 40-80]